MVILDIRVRLRLCDDTPINSRLKASDSFHIPDHTAGKRLKFTVTVTVNLF
jgi:hypothetical protein